MSARYRFEHQTCLWRSLTSQFNIPTQLINIQEIPAHRIVKSLVTLNQSFALTLLSAIVFLEVPLGDGIKIWIVSWYFMNIVGNVFE